MALVTAVRSRISRSFQITIVILIFALGSTIANAQFSGSYGRCDFACQSIQIRPDGTFLRRIDGDLFNGEETKGRWTRVGNNRIHAVSDAVGKEPEVIEGFAKLDGTFLVTVLDEGGLPLPDVWVAGVSTTGESSRSRTDEAGQAVIPTCERFTIIIGNSARGFRSVYRVRDRRANIFELHLSFDLRPAVYIDEVWVIENGRLYFTDSKGTRLTSGYLERIERGVGTKSSAVRIRSMLRKRSAKGSITPSRVQAGLDPAKFASNYLTPLRRNW